MTITSDEQARKKARESRKKKRKKEDALDARARKKARKSRANKAKGIIPKKKPSFVPAPKQAEKQTPKPAPAPVAAPAPAPVAAAAPEPEKKPTIAERIENVGDVFLALNPFSKEPARIEATTNSRVANLILEGAANNPITTALVLTGVGGLVRAGVGLVTKAGSAAVMSNAAVGARVAATTASKGIATNTVTKKATSKMLVAAGFTVAAVIMVEKMVSTYPFATFEIAESMDKLAYARSRAADAGRDDLVDQLNQLEQEILNPEGWEKVLASLPYTNIQRAAKENIKAAQAGTDVMNKVIEDNRIQRETGESDDDKWSRVREEQAEQDKVAVDYYNEQRKLQVQWELEAKAAARAATSKAERKARDEDAKFWAKERAKQREKEAEDRKAIADFWTAYRKQTVKLANDSRPSNLNFGLL